MRVKISELKKSINGLTAYLIMKGKKESVSMQLVRLIKIVQLDNQKEKKGRQYMTGKRVRKAFWGNNDPNLPNMIKLPGGSVVKNLPANAGEIGLIPVSGRSPGEGNGNPLQYSCLGNPIVRGAWQATVHGVA